MSKKLTLSFLPILFSFLLLPTLVSAQTNNEQPTLQVTSPNGGEKIKEGGKLHITWTASKQIQEVSIFYFTCETCMEVIATHVPNTGSYDWKVKVYQPYGKEYFTAFVVGFTADGSTVSDESDDLIQYTPPTNAKPVPEPTDDLVTGLKTLKDFMNNKEFDAFEHGLQPNTFATWPKPNTTNELSIAKDTPMMIAFPDPNIFESAVIQLDYGYFRCVGTSQREGKNIVYLCYPDKVGKSTIGIYTEDSAHPGLQLWKEIRVNITSSLNPTPSPSPISSSSFSDVFTDNIFLPAITTLRDKSIITGYADGSFKPNASVNRAEFAKIIVGALTQNPTGENCFTDVSSQWFAPYVCYAKEKGIIAGYPDGTFGPEKNINYAEALKITLLAFGKMQAPTAGSGRWYDAYFTTAKDQGLLTLLVDFSADTAGALITRAQTAQLIVNLMQNE